jgi:hypothetical protein
MPAAYEGTNFISLSASAENFTIHEVNYFTVRPHDFTKKCMSKLHRARQRAVSFFARMGIFLG